MWTKQFKKPDLLVEFTKALDEKNRNEQIPYKTCKGKDKIKLNFSSERV